MRRAFTLCPPLALAGLVLAGLGCGVTATQAGAATEVSSTVVTNLAGLARCAEAEENLAHSFRLEGVVWWVNPAQQRLVLQDDSSAQTLEAQLAAPFPKVGDRVRLEGISTVRRRGLALRLGPKDSVLDNDGVHASLEKSGSVYLEAGPQPLRLEWFNALEGFALELHYEGPGVPRQPLAAPAREPGATNALLPGLEFRCYEVTDDVLPDFTTLMPIKAGVVANFDLGILPRSERIGVVFEGTLAVPRPGLYTFHLKSDDGSRLFVGQPTIRANVIGTSPLPQPHRLAPGQIWNAPAGGQWIEVEGKVSLVRSTPAGWQLELAAGAGQMILEIGRMKGNPPDEWRHARIRATGVGQGVVTPDGQTVAGVLLVPSANEIKVLESAAPTDSAPPTPPHPDHLPWLTTAAAVHQLKREEAQRAYPVKLRGVVTCVLPEHQAFTIQDATRGIYVVDLSPVRPDAPQLGEFLEIEGTTDPSLFAPIVNARRVRSLGAGRSPEVIKPMWDQLLNGSLDAQQVELQGIVTLVHSNAFTLLLRGGVVKVELRWNGRPPDNLPSYENALVRIRGCLFASWDYVTHQVKMGEVRVYAADVEIEQPAPADLFSTPRKTASELLLFDPQAGVFQRVKVAGQIVHGQDTEFLLMDGRAACGSSPNNPWRCPSAPRWKLSAFPICSAPRHSCCARPSFAKLASRPCPPPARSLRKT
jgi:hypothetical protein